MKDGEQLTVTLYIRLIDCYSSISIRGVKVPLNGLSREGFLINCSVVDIVEQI